MAKPRAQAWTARGLPLALFLVALALVVAAWVPWARYGLGLALFTRLRPDAVHEHGTRQRILGLAAERPGITMQALQGELGIAWGTVVHHVQVLERHGRLVSVRQGPRRHIYVAATPEARHRAPLSLLRTGTAHGIAQAIRERPGIQQVEVCRLLGLRPPAASKHLARMAAAGLVTVQREGGACRYAPTTRLHEVLDLRRFAHEGGGAGRPPRPPAVTGVRSAPAHAPLAAVAVRPRSQGIAF